MTPNVKSHPVHGFPQLDPKPAADELQRFYESKYYDPLRKSAPGTSVGAIIEASAKNESDEDRAWRFETEHVDIAHYLEALAPGRRVVDIGAGIGELVESLASRGFDALGIEPSQEASTFAQAAGRKVIASDLASFWGDSANHGAFHGVTLMNVLEHVPDPEATLRQLRDLLMPGGTLMIRSPNDFSPIQAAAVAARGLRKWWIANPDHISYFSHATIARLLQAEGFEVKIATCDFPIDWFLLMGRDYITTPKLGSECHAMRRTFERSLPASERRRLYEALASAGSGRNLIVYARKT